jgi:uncharacterized protein YbbK (DUF523 family)
MELDWNRIRRASPKNPLRVMFSACTLGQATGWEGVAYPAEMPMRLAGLPSVVAVPFCPEDLVLGTPRALTTLFDGNGNDLWEGTARVMDTEGYDQSEALKRGAKAMVERAKSLQIELCVLLDMSDSCGLHVVYDQEPGMYQPGPGVAAAALLGAGIPIVAQRDFRTLGRILSLLDPGFEALTDARDVVDEDWYQRLRAAWGQRP